VTRLSPPLPCSNYLPSFLVSFSLCPHIAFRLRKSDAVRTKFINPPRRAVESSGSVSTPLHPLRCAWEGFAFLGLYRKHAHVPCIKPGGGGRGSVSGGVVSCPSCSTASVVACHARDSESTGQPCFTSRRFADSVPRQCPVISPLFFSPDSVANYTWGMFVGRVRGDQAEFRRVFFLFFFNRRLEVKLWR